MFTLFFVLIFYTPPLCFNKQRNLVSCFRPSTITTNISLYFGMVHQAAIWYSYLFAFIFRFDDYVITRAQLYFSQPRRNHYKPLFILHIYYTKIFNKNQYCYFLNKKFEMDFFIHLGDFYMCRRPEPPFCNRKKFWHNSSDNSYFTCAKHFLLAMYYLPL